MAKEIDWEIRQYAEELYITDGHTYEEVAKETGVSISQLKRWATDEGWTDRKRDYRKSLSDIKRNTVLLRKNLLDQAVNSLDAQNVYAFAAIERACAPKVAKNAGQAETPDTVINRAINTPEEALAAIQDVLELKINGMLTKPDAVSPKAISDLLKLIEKVQDLEKEYKPDDASDAPKGITPKSARAMIDEILGGGK